MENFLEYLADGFMVMIFGLFVLAVVIVPIFRIYASWSTQKAWSKKLTVKVGPRILCPQHALGLKVGELALLGNPATCDECSNENPKDAA